jgi:hypothetical protein
MKKCILSTVTILLISLCSFAAGPFTSGEDPAYYAQADSVAPDSNAAVDLSAVAEVPREKEKKKLPPPAKRIEYGANGGVSSSFGKLNSSRYNVNPNIGFNIGVFVRVYAFKNFYIQPSVHYYFTTYKFRDLQDQNLAEDKVTYHDMRIPVIAGYTVINSSKFMFRFSTGPSIGFNLGVSDNDLGINNDTFKKVYADWLVHAQMRIAVVTIHGGFSGGMSKYINNSRSHTWYAGFGFSM